MKFIKLFLSFGFILFFTSAVTLGQSNTVTSGGATTSSNGSISYSIGQIDYSSNLSFKGDINEGIQHPFEIFTVSVNQVLGGNTEFKVFPNPTSGELVLATKNRGNLKFLYQIFDSNGHELNSKNVVKHETVIHMGSFSSGTYFLNVYQNGKQVSVFKILKTQ